MNLSQTPRAYEAVVFDQWRRAVQDADGGNFKKGQDMPLVRGERLILKDTVTSALYALTIAAGVVTVTGPL